MPSGTPTGALPAETACRWDCLPSGTPTGTLQPARTPRTIACQEKDALFAREGGEELCRIVSGAFLRTASRHCIKYVPGQTERHEALELMSKSIANPNAFHAAHVLPKMKAANVHFQAAQTAQHCTIGQAMPGRPPPSTTRCTVAEVAERSSGVKNRTCAAGGGGHQQLRGGTIPPAALYIASYGQ